MDEQNNNVDYEEERRRRKAEIMAKIHEYERKIHRLEKYIEMLQYRADVTNEGSYIPESEYDLSVSEDIEHWKGKLQSKGVDHQESTASGISDFLSGIGDVISKIQKLITKYYKRIEKLRAELESI